MGRGNSQPPACLPPWTCSQHASLCPQTLSPQRLQGAQRQQILQPLPPAFQGRPLKFREGRVLSLGKASMHGHHEGFLLPAVLGWAGRIPRGRKRDGEGTCLRGEVSLRLYPRGSGHSSTGEGASYWSGVCVWGGECLRGGLWKDRKCPRRGRSRMPR